MLKTLKETLLKSGDSCLIVKKGKMYLTIRNNELAKSSRQGDAIAFSTEEQIEHFIGEATIDSRNARVIGNGYAIVPVTRP